MTKEMAQATPNEPGASDLEALTPLSSHALFWRAAYVAPSPALAHLPLLFWLVEAARPAVIVTLGVSDAVPHFAACQAAGKLGLDALCLGIARASAQTGPSSDDPGDDLEDVQTYSDRHHSDISQILRAGPENTGSALAALNGAEIDLLIVNRPAGPAVLDEIDRVWLPLLSDRAILLFLQGREETGGQARGAALETYVCDISQEDGVFTVDAKTGACLALYGPRQSDRLRRLAALRPGRPGYRGLCNVFARLGELHTAPLRRTQEDEAARKIQADADRLKEQLARRDAELQSTVTSLKDDLAAQGEAAEADRQHLQTMLQTQGEEMADAIQRAETAEHAAAQIKAELSAARMTHEQECTALRGERDEIAREMTTFRRSAAQLKTELSTARTTHEQECAALRDEQRRAMAAFRRAAAQIEDSLQGEQKASAQECTALQGEVKNLQGELALEREKSAALKRELDERLLDLAALGNLLDTRAGDIGHADEMLGHEKAVHHALALLLEPKERVQAALTAPRMSRRHRDMRARLASETQTIRESGLFDAEWYGQTYPDLATSPLSPLEHFVQLGAYEGRSPGPDFDSIAYHVTYPEVAENGMTALLHYTLYGRAEGREITPAKG